MNYIEEALCVVEAYFHATYNGDAGGIKKVFHEVATISGYIEDEFYTWTVDQFVANIAGQWKIINKLFISI
jgi:uncharacterized protein YyaL (SSP411 family)